MGKYKRHHGNKSNYSNGAIIVLSLAAILAVGWKFMNGWKKAQRIHEIEQQELNDKTGPYYIITDSGFIKGSQPK